MSYDWIAEDIRWLEARKWRTNDEEHQLKGLYELKEALQKLYKSDKLLPTLEEQKSIKIVEALNEIVMSKLIGKELF